MRHYFWGFSESIASEFSCAMRQPFTAGIGRMGPPRKIDLFLIDHFVIFSIRTIKMYGILVDYIGNVVMKKYMHAAIHWIIK